MNTAFAVVTGLIAYVLLSGFGITGVGLPFGHLETVMWTETLYWGIILPLFIFMIAFIFYYFLIAAYVAKPEERHRGWAIVSMISWILAFLSAGYTFIVYLIVLIGCSGNVQCDKMLVCDGSSTLGPYAGARPRFIALLVQSILLIIIGIILIIVAITGMGEPKTEAVGARKSTMKIAPSSSKNVKIP